MSKKNNPPQVIEENQLDNYPAQVIEENQLSNSISSNIYAGGGGCQKTDPPTPASTRGKSIRQLLYSEFPPKLRKKIKAFEEKTKKNDRMFCTGQIFSVNEVYDKISWELLKTKTTELSRAKNMPIFLFIPNYSGVMTPILQERTEKVPLTLLRMSMTGNLIFLDDTTDLRYHREKGYTHVDFYEYFINVDGVICPFYTLQRLPSLGVPYFFNALKVPLRVKKKQILGAVNATENVYLCSSVNKIKENFGMLNKYVKNIQNVYDLSLVWDFDNNQSIYSAEELYIILSNIFYLEEGNCALDLILCGKPSAKKTAWLDMLSEIFSDKVVMSVNATHKSLIPSFYFDNPKPGVLCESKFITLLDDYFRMFGQSTQYGIYVSIRQGLESIMNLLDRKEKSVPSGKKDINVKYNASFFATDNFGYHETLVKVYDEDPAILRRYTFLLLESETENRGTSVGERDINEVISLTKKKLRNVFGEDCFTKYRLLFTYLRNITPKVCFETVKFQNIINKYKNHDVYLQGKAKALIKSVIALNTIFRWNKEGIPKLNDFKAREEDYVLFDKLLGRVVNDFVKATKRIISLNGSDFEKLKEEDIK